MSDRSLAQRYLDSLDLGPGRADFDFLKAQQSAHLARYSFNNLGVLLGEERPLEISALFRTIVAERKGGYCFEHNGLFYEILRELGYEASAQLARVLLNREVEEPVMPRTHRLTVVTMGSERYVVDVGFGVLTPFEPVRISEEETVHSNGERYRIRRNRVGDYLLETLREDGPFVLYAFDLNRTVDADFEMGHFYSHRHPKAAFLNNLVISKVTAEERRVIRNHEVEVIRGGRTVTSPLQDAAELQQRLAEEFDYPLDTATAGQLFAKFCTAPAAG